MADRIEREIEEILKKLDVDEEAASKTPPRRGSGRPPIPISSHRGRKSNSGPGVSGRLGNAFSMPALSFSPSSLIIAGAVLALVGFVLAGISSGLIWVSVAGIFLFILGFGLSFIKRPSTRRAVGPSGPTKKRWRDREIEYDTDDAGPQSRGSVACFRR